MIVRPVTTAPSDWQENVLGVVLSGDDAFLRWCSVRGELFSESYWNTFVLSFGAACLNCTFMPSGYLKVEVGHIVEWVRWLEMDYLNNDTTTFHEDTIV